MHPDRILNESSDVFCSIIYIFFRFKRELHIYIVFHVNTTLLPICLFVTNFLSFDFFFNDVWAESSNNRSMVRTKVTIGNNIKIIRRNILVYKKSIKSGILLGSGGQYVGLPVESKSNLRSWISWYSLRLLVLINLEPQWWCLEVTSTDKMRTKSFKIV